MAKINLLPWREQLREEQLKQFYYMLGFFVFVSLLLMVFIHLTMAYRINSQTERNKTLKQEINLLKGKIYAIHSLRDKKDRLITRINIIKELQTNRPLAVYLFDSITSVIPNGIVLTEIQRKGNTITFTGMAESHSQVSIMMKRVNDSKWLMWPKLNEIKETKGKQLGTQYFKLKATIRIPHVAASNEVK